MADTAHVHVFYTAVHSKLVWWTTNHRRAKFKKCPKMCILFHIIIQCLHTGIFLKLLKGSVKKKKVRRVSVYKFLPLPKIHTNKIHFKTISSQFVFSWIYWIFHFNMKNTIEWILKVKCWPTLLYWVARTRFKTSRSPHFTLLLTYLPFTELEGTESPNPHRSIKFW